MTEELNSYIVARVLELNTMLEEYDWVHAFGVAGSNVQVALGSTVSTDNILANDVEEIFAYEEGGNDECDWILVARMFDGRFIFLSAGCDFTGWDCQAWGTCVVSHSLDHLVRFGMTDESRSRLKMSVR